MEKRERIERSIVDLLEKRGAGKSICPSEVARQLGEADWRAWMEPVREIARELASAGRIRLTQGERELAAEEAIKGPVRLRLSDEGSR